MKNVFFIHSFITYYVSLGVIKINGYLEEDCVFLFHRHFNIVNNKEGIRVYNFPFEYFPFDSFPVYKKFWRGWKALSKLDDFLFEITKGETFHFFSPHTGLKMFQLIISHRRCAGFSYLEEGAISYWRPEELKRNFQPKNKNLMDKIYSFLSYPGRLKKINTPFHPEYGNVYGLQKSSFPSYKKRIVVDLLIPKKNIDYKNILVLDSLVESRVISADVLYNTLLFFIKYAVKAGLKEVHYKFHPTQTKVPKNVANLRYFFNSFQSEIRFIELEETVSLEEVSFNSSANFFVFVSSIAIYAAMAGREVFSLSKIIEKFDSDFKYKDSNLPDYFRSNVKFLSFS